jgi:hypothetical protein
MMTAVGAAAAPGTTVPDGQAADMVAADANTVAGDNDDSDNDNDNDNDNGSDSATVTLPRVLRIDDAVPLLEVCAGNVVVFVWLFLYGCVCVCVCFHVRAGACACSFCDYLCVVLALRD